MKQNLRLKSFQGSNIKVTDDDAIPTKTSDSGVCRLANPVSLDQTYCISWEMKLRGNDEDNSCSSRKFGFFRFGFVTNEQQSLIQLSIYSGKKHAYNYNFKDCCDAWTIAKVE